MSETIVIVGAGQAGGEIAAQLRKLNFSGRVVIVGDEPHPPYKRPQLSKAYLAGKIKAEALHLMRRSVLDTAGIELRDGVRVTSIDREARRVLLDDGRELLYDRLALATGGRARTPELPGIAAPNVFALRTIADVDRMRDAFTPGSRLVIVGGGYIGLEVAAVAVESGLDVTLLESLPRVLARVAGPAVSTFFEETHRRAGVDVRTSTQVAALEGEPSVTHVMLRDGTRISCDLVVVGVGQVPNTEVGEQAGLTVDDGIVVDEFERTSDPRIVAAGDCTSRLSPLFGRRIRLESVHNATQQAKVAAATLVGAPHPGETVPWFWSDQYDLKLQTVGLLTGFDEVVVRGDPRQRSFSAFYLSNGRLIAADAVSRPRDFAAAKKLVAAGVTLPARQLADDTIPLTSILASHER